MNTTTPDDPMIMLVLNGKSAGEEPVRDAVMAMREAGMPLAVRVTWEGGDAERYVREAVEAGAVTVIAGGGDGTLSEVAEALAHFDADADGLPTLGLLPLGTANDFATATCIPEEPEAAMQLVRDTPPHHMDLLRIQHDGRDHWCANLASGGFGTEVTVETHETLKSMLGGLAYVITGLGKLGNIEPQHARFTGPDFEWEGDFIALGIGNGRQAGGGQVLCPDALVDDGLLDLTVIPPLEGEVMNTLGSVLMEGAEAALDRVSVRAQLPWVEIRPAKPLTLNLDGEPVKSTAFRIECVPSRVRMHLPGSCGLVSSSPREISDRL